MSETGGAGEGVSLKEIEEFNPAIGKEEVVVAPIALTPEQQAAKDALEAEVLANFGTSTVRGEGGLESRIIAADTLTPEQKKQIQNLTTTLAERTEGNEALFAQVQDALFAGTGEIDLSKLLATDITLDADAFRQAISTVQGTEVTGQQIDPLTGAVATNIQAGQVGTDIGVEGAQTGQFNVTAQQIEQPGAVTAQQTGTQIGARTIGGFTQTGLEELRKIATDPSVTFDQEFFETNVTKPLFDQFEQEILPQLLRQFGSRASGTGSTDFQQGMSREIGKLRDTLARERSKFTFEAIQAAKERQQTAATQLGQVETGARAVEGQFEVSRAEQIGRLSMADADRGLTAMIANQDNEFRTAQTNQQAGLEAALSTAGFDLQSFLGTQASTLKAAIVNQQTEQFNVDANLRAELSNQSSALSVELANQGIDLQRLLANQEIDIQAQLSNQNVDLQAALANQAADQFSIQTAQQLALQNQGFDLEAMTQSANQRLQELGLVGENALRSDQISNTLLTQLLTTPQFENIAFGEPATQAKTDNTGSFLTAAASIASALIVSDARLKENILPIPEEQLEYFRKIEARGYNYKGEKRITFGLIAQDLEQEYPDLVFTDDFGLKRIDLYGIVGLLIAEVSSLRKKVEEK